MPSRYQTKAAQAFMEFILERSRADALPRQITDAAV
jgi:hypothetical protein